MVDILSIAQQFVKAVEPGDDGAALSVAPYGSGNINDTFVVEPANQPRFVLQRINQHVFRKPELIMLNLRTVVDQIALQPAPDEGARRWELPRIVPTRQSQDFVYDSDGGFWRALTFIEGATAWPKVRDAHHAHEAGYALGRFQRQISDIDVSRLHDTLPGFHIMVQYLRHYDEVVAEYGIDLSQAELRHGADIIARRRDWAPVLQRASNAGQLPVRPMHGDPKIDNIMIDEVSGDAVGVIDLDTVKPGLVQYDIGDCLRSSCNPLGEETRDINEVTFELDLCEMILKGYLPQVQPFYTAADYRYLFDSLRVLAFEMGLRFFTDYLEDNVYFKTHYPENNLYRALVQFQLMLHIEGQEPKIRHMVDALAGM